jgi:hypothetical protein
VTPLPVLRAPPGGGGEHEQEDQQTAHHDPSVTRPIWAR